jgi:hypothetical protein
MEVEVLWHVHLDRPRLHECTINAGVTRLEVPVSLSERYARAALRSYPCIYCGPPSPMDFNFRVQDEIADAYSIMDNFKAALANK